jgi:4-phytase / acid phosphatase
MHTSLSVQTRFQQRGASLRPSFMQIFLTISFLLGTTQTVFAQTVNQNDELQGVIVLIRHGVRAPIETEIRASSYNAQPWPAWSVPQGVLSEHGTKAAQLLAEYYRDRYSSLLEGTSCDHPAIYSETTSAQRTIATAKAMLPVLAPNCTIDVHQRKLADPYPLFSAVAGADRQRLQDATLGRIGQQWPWFVNAFAEPLEEMHKIMTTCSGQNCNPDKPDFRTVMVRNGVALPRDPEVENPVTLGADFAEHFLLDYTEGLPMEQVGWGRVDRKTLNRLMQMNTLYHDFMARTPYAAQVNASNLAARISDTLSAMASKKDVPGALGSPRDRLFLLVAHDGNIATLGGLFRMEWLLPDQSFNATPPAGGYAFELHRNKTTGAETVRVVFISQTLDQMRYLKPLRGGELPTVASLFLPGCSGPGPDYLCSLDGFRQMVRSSVLTNISH